MPGKKLRKPVEKKEKKKKIVKEPVKDESNTSKDLSTVQAVVFAKGWTLPKSRDWLKKNKFKPKGKVHKTKNGTFKYTIVDEDKFEKLGFKKTNKGVSFVLGINPKPDPLPAE